jgi:hypothetical protein
MDAASGRGRSAAEIKPLNRRLIERGSGAEEQLAKIHGPSREIAADQIRIPAFEHSGRGDSPRDNTISETRSETLDLSFDLFHTIPIAAVGYMAVDPGGVAACRSAGGIEQRGLDEQDERAL